MSIVAHGCCEKQLTIEPRLKMLNVFIVCLFMKNLNLIIFHSLFSCQLFLKLTLALHRTDTMFSVIFPQSWCSSSALSYLYALSVSLSRSIPHNTSMAQNHLSCRFLRSSECLSIPELPPSHWLVVCLPAIPH